MKQSYIVLHLFAPILQFSTFFNFMFHQQLYPDFNKLEIKEPIVWEKVIFHMYSIIMFIIYCQC